MVQLEQALTVAEKDTKDASEGVMKDLRRFQSEKENDVRRYMVRRPFPLPLPLPLPHHLPYPFLSPQNSTCANPTCFRRWNSHNATSTGRAATRPRGKKRAQRSPTSSTPPTSTRAARSICR